MNNVETDFDEGTSEKKPRKSRKRNEERDIFVYRIVDGKPKKQGSFPETVVGTPLERRLPMFLKEIFGEGEYRTDIRKPNGHFESSLDFSIAAEPDRADREKQNIIEPEDFDDEPEDSSLVENDGQMNALQLQLSIERAKTKRLEAELQAVKIGSQNEKHTIVSALEKAHERTEQVWMLMLSQAQKPQQDATSQAMNILEKSLGIVTKAKAISEEIAPQETNSNGSLLSDASKLVDSLGKNAGQFLPLFFNRSVPTAKPPMAQRVPKPPVTNGNGQGDLSNLLNKVKGKKENEKK